MPAASFFLLPAYTAISIFTFTYFHPGLSSCSTIDFSLYCFYQFCNVSSTSYNTTLLGWFCLHLDIVRIRVINFYIIIIIFAMSCRLPHWCFGKIPLSLFSSGQGCHHVSPLTFLLHHYYQVCNVLQTSSLVLWIPWCLHDVIPFLAVSSVVMGQHHYSHFLTISILP